MENVKNKIYKVRIENLVWLHGKINYLQKRQGGSQLKLIELGKENLGKNGKDLIVMNVQVVGETPKIDGWKPVAVIEHHEGMNLIGSIPTNEIEIPKSYWMADAKCEHCGHKRHRKETILIANESGEIKQIGRNCLADYVRGDWARTLTWMAELDRVMDSGSEEGFSGGFVKNIYSVDYIIERTVRALSALNVDWISKQDRNDLTRWITGKYNGVTTQEKAQDAKELEDKFGHGSADKSKIDQVNNFWNNADKTKLDNFKSNLLSIFLSKEVVNKRLSLSIWIALSVLMETEEGRALRLKAAKYAEEKEQRRVVDQKKEYVGNVGQKIEMKLKIVYVGRFYSAYGAGLRISFEDENGNKLVWFSSNGCAANGYEYNKFYNWKFTIKAHDTFKDVKQTVITRAKVVNVDKPVDAVDNSTRQ